VDKKNGEVLPVVRIKGKQMLYLNHSKVDRKTGDVILTVRMAGKQMWYLQQGGQENRRCDTHSKDDRKTDVVPHSKVDRKTDVVPTAR
jgi:hypothetical protein